MAKPSKPDIIELPLSDFPTVSDARKRTMLNALKATLGNVTAAARKAMINRDTHYDWMKNDPNYKKAAEQMSDMALDFAEGKLFELINGVTVQQQTKEGTVVYQREPNVAATIFYLKTRGKKRGYIERLQLEDIGDDEIDTTLDV